MPTNKNSRHTGGRPYKLDKEKWGQITCVLRHDTIAMLRAGAASKHFGEYLQAHLDRHPPPSRDEYLALSDRKPLWTTVRRGKKIQTIIAAGSSYKAARKLARERARRDKLTPDQIAWEDSIREGVAQVTQEIYGDKS